MPDSTKIFISYSRQDEAAADRIFSALSDVGLGPWIDRKRIVPGESITEAIQGALQEASYLLLLWSAHAADSFWVNKEWTAALASKDTLIVPVRLDDTELPVLLLDVLAVDLRQGSGGGFESLTEFFANEMRVLPPDSMRGPDDGPLKGASRRQIRMVAERCVDEVVLKKCAWDLGVDPGSLGGSSVHERIVSLMYRFEQDGWLAGFAEWLELERDRCVAHQVRQLSGTPAWKGGMQGG